ncbi:unnamed protein product [Linum trigynum]|uniref:Uncharacterized protein n=1 Tax=Linum trigynum TaxID=586398 RepID=A0AAV2FCE7_9ROSI
MSSSSSSACSTGRGTQSSSFTIIASGGIPHAVVIFFSVLDRERHAILVVRDLSSFAMKQNKPVPSDPPKSLSPFIMSASTRSCSDVASSSLGYLHCLC